MIGFHEILINGQGKGNPGSRATLNSVTTEKTTHLNIFGKRSQTRRTVTFYVMFMTTGGRNGRAGGGSDGPESDSNYTDSSIQEKIFLR